MSEINEEILKDAKYRVCETCSSYCVCKRKGKEHIEKCPIVVNYIATGDDYSSPFRTKN